MIVHMNAHKNARNGPEDSVTFKSTCERPEIQGVNILY